MTTDTATTIVREVAINAPATKIFAALTVPSELVQWWGDPATYQVTSMESDLRVGGAWKSHGHGSDGEAFFVHGVYRAIEAPNVLEYTWRYSWDGDAATETLVRFDLVEHAGVTNVRLTHSGFTDQAAVDTHNRGWGTILGWLDRFVTAT